MLVDNTATKHRERRTRKAKKTIVIVVCRARSVLLIGAVPGWLDRNHAGLDSKRPELPSTGFASITLASLRCAISSPHDGKRLEHLVISHIVGQSIIRSRRCGPN